jgi:integrase
MATYRKRGKSWEYRIRFKDKLTGKPDEISKGGFATEQEARYAGRKAEEMLDRNGFKENGDELFETFARTWLEVYKKPHLKPNSIISYTANLENHIIPRFGKQRLKDITRTDYQRWINDLSKTKKRNTIRVLHSIVYFILQSAVDDFNFLYKNPVDNIKMPKEEVVVKPVKTLSKEELDTLLAGFEKQLFNSIYNFQYHAFFSLIARTGIRIGECLALTWDDIDFDTKTLSVNKTLMYVKQPKPYAIPPKSKASLRSIRLDDKTLKLLQKHRTEQKKWVISDMGISPSPFNLIFHQTDGLYLRPQVIRPALTQTCKMTGVPHMTIHNLRHTHAVHLIETGIPVKYVSERLGHASVNTTLNIYVHVTKQMENDAMERYEKYMG